MPSVEDDALLGSIKRHNSSKKNGSPLRKILSKPRFSTGRKSNSDSDYWKASNNNSNHENYSFDHDHESLATDESTPKKAPPSSASADRNSSISLDPYSPEERIMWVPMSTPPSRKAQEATKTATMTTSNDVVGVSKNGTTMKSALKPKKSSWTDNVHRRTSILSNHRRKILQRVAAVAVVSLIMLSTVSWMGVIFGVESSNRHRHKKQPTHNSNNNKKQAFDQSFLDLRLKVIEFETGL